MNMTNKDLAIWVIVSNCLALTLFGWPIALVFNILAIIRSFKKNNSLYGGLLIGAIFIPVIGIVVGVLMLQDEKNKQNQKAK
ncbi:Uncharacterised protein [Metamycoplasma arthritidis]|uniref:Hypothetical membrane protein n=1 Tax=Metamycoplasma arthritidis (strain 158L3-1) TaxID=243272 RepID=B3PNC0_META1|nr:hypothetical protein [Metamycoplasma arthritidis]ACF07522.1 hypothetical membrane protein [Metamycoplasma arthritidis 158L3-1]VEU79030.1 Uncharacterised protein [Metamycoplasma arthritidis]